MVAMPILLHSLSSTTLAKYMGLCKRKQKKIQEAGAEGVGAATATTSFF